MNDIKNDSNNKNDVLIKEIADWVKHILIAVIVAFLLLNYVVLNANVPTESMENTIMVGDRLFANRLAYKFGEPQCGDIVVFRYPDNESVLFVKRIIGLPGDTIEIKNGSVYINNNPLNEPYIREPMNGSFGPYKVPQGQYFMMGDNRNNSKDSRYWQNKFVMRDKILGKALIKYFPQIKLF